MRLDDARRRIHNFVETHRGQSVFFKSLKDDEERMDYVLTKTYSYFNHRKNDYDLSNAEILHRAVNNAESHRRDRFEVFNEDINEHLVIAK